MTNKTVLVLGADGFIGRQVVFALRDAGWAVLACARRTGRLAQMGFDTLQVDLTDPAFHVAEGWSPHLDGVTHVVNAAGLLSAPNPVMHAVHTLAPQALYEAMDAPRGVLISAVGLAADTAFAKHRTGAETKARDAGLSIIRPGLVLGDTSYGGSSLGRALAAMPCVTPLVGGGQQQINPIHVHDLAQLVCDAITQPPNTSEAGGDETLTQAQMLAGYRQWLGLPPARSLSLPLPLARLTGRIGDALRMGPISETAVMQLNTSLIAKTDQPTRGFSKFLWSRPAGTQDLWQARLYLLKPLIRLTLALLWLASAGIGLLLPASNFLPIFADSGLSHTVLVILARGGGLVDLAIGLALLRNWRPKFLTLIQFAMVAGYTMGLTFLSPDLWLLPFGGLLKNLPILVLLLIHLSMNEER